MMDLLLKLNERLNETEQALEKALKDKHGESTSQPPEVIPIVSIAVPSTLGTVLAPNLPTATTEVITGTTTAGTNTRQQRQFEHRRANKVNGGHETPSFRIKTGKRTTF